MNFSRFPGFFPAGKIFFNLICVFGENVYFTEKFRYTWYYMCKHCYFFCRIPTQFSCTFPILKVNTAPEKVIEYDTLYVQCHQDSTNHKGFASKSSISLLKFTKNGLKKKLRKSWPRIDLQSLKRKN